MKKSEPLQFVQNARHVVVCRVFGWYHAVARCLFVLLTRFFPLQIRNSLQSLIPQRHEVPTPYPKARCSGRPHTSYPLITNHYKNYVPLQSLPSHASPPRWTPHCINANPSITRCRSLNGERRQYFGLRRTVEPLLD